jgi:hypothetical protein
MHCEPCSPDITMHFILSNQKITKNSTDLSLSGNLPHVRFKGVTYLFVLFLVASKILFHFFALHHQSYNLVRTTDDKEHCSPPYPKPRLTDIVFRLILNYCSSVYIYNS